MRLRPWAPYVLLALVASVAQARDLPYGSVSAPVVQRCDALQWSPQQVKAAECYRALLQSGAGAAERAEAAWALGDLQAANTLFRQAVASDAGAAPRVRWGELYIDTHQDQQALDLFKEAQQREPNNAYARVDAARVLSNQFSDAANQSLQPVLADTKAPAGARLRALLLAARLALEDSDLSRAGSLLEQAQSVASDSKLTLLDVYALRAGLELLSGRDGDRWSQMALQLDPAFGDAYATPAYFYVITRRYHEALTLYQKAIAAQPDLWSARVELANCLLRENRVSEARLQLEAAYKGDPFNPVTVNTLRLLDSLGRFDVVAYGADARDAMPSVVFKFDKKESAVLAPYARTLALKAIDTYSQRYQYRLREPVIVEVYSNHEDFAVRTAGMPGIGLLGVTFGYLIAMDSPSSRAVNEFHWGTTLWHEMAHVFTLESTDHKVPRWLSEGLSVFEEWRTGPIRGMEIPNYALAALAAGKALPITQLDRGFIHPSYEQQVQVSYMQAGLVCDFIDRTFGFDRLRALLRAYTDTSDTSLAVQQALGVSAEEFDRRFAADLRQQFGALFEQIDSWQQARAEAAAAAARSEWGAADTAAHKALALLPQDVDEGSPYLPLERAEQAQGQTSQQLQTLEEYWHRGGHDPQALLPLARSLHTANRAADALAVMQAIDYVAPFDDEQHGLYGDWLLEVDRPADALQEYRVAAALNPPDQAALHLRLARAQYALHVPAEAHREVLAALEIAPNYVPAQQLLLKLTHDSVSSSHSDHP